ncbi:unnamed protein product [Ectocarpus fasciculatus]
MLQECMDHLQPCAGKLFVDGTLGGGGHTAAVLETGAHVISIDQDDDAIETSSRRLQSYLSCQQLEIRKGNFRSIEHIVSTSRLFQGRPVDGILLDLGMSSHQIDVGSRGFSFQNDGPLDMRMDKEGSSATTALDIVNSWTGDQLADLFYQFGGEGNSRKIAREIIASRPIKTTQQLSTVICRQTPSPITQKTLARCFQALRIFINDEMGALDTVLIGAVRCLKPGGVLCVLSYHSLEDRRVKLAFQNKYPEQFEFSLNAPVSVPIDDYISLHQDFCWEPIKKKAILPSKVEVKENSRARSAKLRAAIKRDKWS